MRYGPKAGDNSHELLMGSQWVIPLTKKAFVIRSQHRPFGGGMMKDGGT